MPGTTRATPRHYAARDTRWLEQRGRTWYAVMAVPRPLWAKLGRRRFVKSLGTRDFHVALAKRHAALAEFQTAFERARADGAAADLTTAALIRRDTLAKLERGDVSEFWMSRPDGGGGEADPSEKLGFALGQLEEEATDIEDEHGPEAARTFVGIARGTATPLLLHVDAWLREGGVKGPLNPRTASQYRADVMDVAKWAGTVGVATVEGFMAVVAGRFVTEQLVAKGVHWATGNRKITAASAYWRWMRKRVGIKEQPWAGQSLAKGTRRGTEAPKRPFTDEEAAALLAGDADPELADAMRAAALTGMRLEEIYSLTAADCAGGWFRLRQAKTRAGIRRVPIHSELAALVARRCLGKGATEFLFHEAGPERPGRGRSMAISKRFGRYRQGVGVHDRDEGKRHSRVDFHSWRRWFVTKARNAGVDRAVVAAVVGHEVGNLTDDTYSGGPSDALLRACVEAIGLPHV